VEIKLPDIGEGIAEGEIMKWLVKEGEIIQTDQSLVEVLTDKAAVEIPAPCQGRIQSLTVKVGELVPVGATLLVLEPPKEAKERISNVLATPTTRK
jgi:pyruvate dehydrogenase E2 component (dihydrolipoamide acetyltransferase)